MCTPHLWQCHGKAGHLEALPHFDVDGVDGSCSDADKDLPWLALRLWEVGFNLGRGNGGVGFVGRWQVRRGGASEVGNERSEVVKRGGE